MESRFAVERLLVTRHVLERAAQRLGMTPAEALHYLLDAVSGKKVGWYPYFVKGQRRGEVRLPNGMIVIVGEPRDGLGGLVLVTCVRQKRRVAVQKEFPRLYVLEPERGSEQMEAAG